MRHVLTGIQAGRGIAAILVVLFHAERALALPQYVGHLPLGGITAFGHAGVDFFFVLSGFIVYYVHNRDIGSASALPRYFWRRVCRVYPPYWVVTLILLLLVIVGKGVDGIAGFAPITNILLLPSAHEPLLGVAWTLEREVVFYILFGLAIVSWRLSMVGILACVTLNLPALPQWPAMAQWPFLTQWPILAQWLESLRQWAPSYYDLLFPVGIGAAWITLRRPMPQPHLWALAGAAIFLATGSAESAGWFPPEGLSGRLIYGGASAMMIMGLSTLDRTGRLRVSQPLMLLGAASYSIYLVHSPVLGYAARLMVLLGLMPRLPDWSTMAVDVGVAIASGIAFHLWVERPLTAMARSLTGGRSASAQHATPGVGSGPSR